MVKLLLPLMISVFIIAVAATMVTTDAGAGPTSSVSAQILGFVRGQSELRFDVVSNGCTNEKDFKLVYSDESEIDRADNLLSLINEDAIVNVQLVRINIDYCRRRPMTQPVIFQAPDFLSGKQLRLVNAFVTLSRKIDRE